MKRSNTIAQLFSVLCSLILILPLTACSREGVQPSENQQPKHSLSTSSAPKDDAISEETYKDGQIQITTEEGNLIVFQLNHSAAAESLDSQLPLSVLVENYGDHEKIFYPPEKLDISNTPLAEGPAGTLAYYEPWGNIAIYYGACGGASGLYELGDTISGAEYLSEMSGEIYIDVAGTASAMPADGESTQKSSAPQSSTPPETSAGAITTSKQAPLPIQPPASNAPEIQPKDNESVETIQVTVGNKTFTATPTETMAAKSFVELMKAAPIVINMSDYSGFEKVGTLGTDLPSSNSNTTAQSGDIVLYNGNQIVVFYGSNTWSYTRLGKIDDLSGWEKALGSGDVTVVFSIE